MGLAGRTGDHLIAEEVQSGQSEVGSLQGNSSSAASLLGFKLVVISKGLSGMQLDGHDGGHLDPSGGAQSVQAQASFGGRKSSDSICRNPYRGWVLAHLSIQAARDTPVTRLSDPVQGSLPMLVPFLPSPVPRLNSQSPGCQQSSWLWSARPFAFGHGFWGCYAGIAMLIPVFACGHACQSERPCRPSQQCNAGTASDTYL